MMITQNINKTKTVVFVASPEEVALFDEVAWNRHMNRSELLRELMQNTIKEGA